MIHSLQTMHIYNKTHDVTCICQHKPVTQNVVYCHVDVPVTFIAINSVGDGVVNLEIQ